jgi:hypothetical protein
VVVSTIRHSLHHAPITAPCSAISAIAISAPPSAAVLRTRAARGANASKTSIVAKNAAPTSGVGMPSGCDHADARTVAQPVSAQYAGAGPR